MTEGDRSKESDELKMRRELLEEILGRSFYGRLREFYKSIFAQNPGLVVLMSRKSWSVFQLFLPILQDEGIDIKTQRITHDRMVHPWLAALDPQARKELKIFIVDDTFQTGRALDDCARRLTIAYNIERNNITVAVFAMTDDQNGYNRRRITVEGSQKKYTVGESASRPEIKSFNVSWLGGEDTFCQKDDVSLFSALFVEALHACSVPYVGYIPAFRLSIKEAEDFFGTKQGKEINFDLKKSKVSRFGSSSTIRIPGYLEQEDLKAPLNNPRTVGYYNITNEQMRQNDVEAFYFSLPEKGSGKNDFLHLCIPEYASSIAALRFYLNRKTGIVLMVPYLSLKDCDADADIAGMFPKNQEKVLQLISGIQSEKWGDREDNLTAHRLLRYAAGYLWGKRIFKEWFGRDSVKKEDIVSFGGICCEEFFDWLNGSEAEQDLQNIWPFFEPGRGNVVEKAKDPKQERETGLEDIIRQGLSEYDVENFCNTIYQYLLLSAFVTVDYYGTLGMLFRNILEREYTMLLEDANENNDGLSLPPPFHGFPIRVFFALLLKNFPKLNKRTNVLTTVTLMLCDKGITVTQLQQHEKTIGTVLINGEQSCHSLAPIAPAYARFLSKLPGDMHNSFKDKEQRREKFEIAKKEIRGYFKKERSRGIFRRLSLDLLMEPLEKIKPFAINDPDPKKGFIPYSVLPETSFFDCSELFFLKLRHKLGLVS